MASKPPKDENSRTRPTVKQGQTKLMYKGIRIFFSG